MPIIPLFMILITLFTITSCIHRPLPSPETLDQRYHAAVKDAEVASPSEIFRDLVAITSWEMDPRYHTDKAIRVVTWTDWEGYDKKVGERLTLSRDTWVTVVPHVKRFCHSCRLTGEALTLRLRQRLGLPPHDTKTRFVEFWVSPDDLFRPSPDPEISDHEAELTYPRPLRFITVSQKHREWMAALEKESYGTDGYPWTRLGYTYDWGGEEEIGESEFVISKGAEVSIHSVTPTTIYCKGMNESRMEQKKSVRALSKSR